MGASSAPKTKNTLTPEQNVVAQGLGKVIRNNIGKGAKKYTGPIVAPLDPGYGQVQSLVDSYDPNAFMTGASDALDELLAGKSAFDLDPAVTDAYFKDSVAAPALRNYQQNIVPQLNSAFAGQGAAFSSRLATAKGQALDNMNANLAAELAKTNLQNQTTRAQLADSAAGRQLSALGLAQQMNLAPLTRATAISSALSPIQTQRQAATTAGYNEWLRTRPENNPYMQLAMSYIGSPVNALYNPQPNPYIGAAIGAGGGALSGAASGALIGSVVPGIGTGIGALIGGLGGLGSGAAAGAR